jgi:hypothetical protein
MAQAPRPASQQADLASSYQTYLNSRLKEDVRRDAQTSIEARIFTHLKQCDTTTRVAGQAILWNFKSPFPRKLRELAALENATTGLFPADIRVVFAANARDEQRRHEIQVELEHALARAPTSSEARQQNERERLLSQGPQIVVHSFDDDADPYALPHVRRPLKFRCCQQFFGCIPSWRSIKNWMWSGT